MKIQENSKDFWTDDSGNTWLGTDPFWKEMGFDSEKEYIRTIEDEYGAWKDEIDYEIYGYSYSRDNLLKNDSEIYEWTNRPIKISGGVYIRKYEPDALSCSMCPPNRGCNSMAKYKYKRNVSWKHKRKTQYK